MEKVNEKKVEQLTDNEKKWLRENIWCRERKLKEEFNYTDNDVLIKTSIYEKLGL